MPFSNALPKTLKALAALALGILAAGSAAAVEPINSGKRGEVAIRGYDPVAYHLSGEPTAGDPAITGKWNDATWRFATAENRDAFLADPERYAPQFGGYCAWAVSNGYTADIDPEAWVIVEDKLYLNYSPRIQRKWSKDRAGNIAKANVAWPKLLAED